MEQLTWPRGSGGHIFSTIPASDYGESEFCLRRKESSHPLHCQNEASATDGHTKNSGEHHFFTHDDHHHNANPLNEQACGYGVDQLSCGPRRFSIRKQHDEKPEFTDKAHISSSCNAKEGRKQEVCFKLGVVHADMIKNNVSMVSMPHTLLGHELSPSITPRVFGNYCERTVNYSHGVPDFTILPDDILLRAMGAFSWKDLWSASRVCHSWCQALAPLRKAMHFVYSGKRFKHGRGGVTRDVDKALHLFLYGAKQGCTAAMVDAGLLLWEMGQKQEGLYWYKQAAQLGDPAGQCNLGLACLQDSSNTAEAVKWFQRAALAGHVRAQYSLALCLQQGKGVDCSIVKAAWWYQRAADGGCARAMYNLALCYRKGEGLIGDSHVARKWMKRAALAGHRKAQFEHGLTLFAESDGGLALVFLELATRAGETAATHLRDALLQQLSPKMRTHAISCADRWQAKLSARGWR